MQHTHTCPGHHPGRCNRPNCPGHHAGERSTPKPVPTIIQGSVAHPNLYSEQRPTQTFSSPSLTAAQHANISFYRHQSEQTNAHTHTHTHTPWHNHTHTHRGTHTHTHNVSASMTSSTAVLWLLEGPTANGPSCTGYPWTRGVDECRFSTSIGRQYRQPMIQAFREIFPEIRTGNHSVRTRPKPASVRGHAP